MNRGWQARSAPTKTDCVAGHVGLELRNVVANYPFESSRSAFAQMVALRQQAVTEDYIRARKAQGQPYDDALLEQEASASMWRNTQKENRIDNRRRFRTFTTGVALVVLGVVGQILGSLPHLPFGIVPCQ